MAGEDGWGVNPESLAHLADEVLAVRHAGHHDECADARGAITAKSKSDVRVMTAMPIHSVAEL